jgi:hypothetical protein
MTNLLATLRESASDLFNVGIVAGTIALGALAPATATPAPVHVHNGFSCVRPYFSEGYTDKGGTFRKTKEFTAYLPCHETYPVDKNGYLVFPEA